VDELTGANRRIAHEPLRPGIAYVDGEGNVVDLSDEEAACLLAHDSDVAFQWRKWLARSGQAKLAPEERTGRIILLDAERVQRTLADHRD
jgi:hypothetical protein